jgi:1-deoxy-D-xylulose-5-phosphate synthase
MLRTIAEKARLVVTLEEGTLRGGFGSAVHEASVEEGLALSVRLAHFGLPDRFLTHGSRGRLLEDAGLSAPQVLEAVLARLARA